MEHLTFKDGYSNSAIDVLQHARDFIVKNPDVEVYVGTDSQNKKKVTVYCTVIAFRYANHRGVHYVYTKQVILKIKDRWTRLWKEAEYTAQVATMLRTNLVPVHYVEVDYNAKDKTAGSYSIVAAAVGYLKGLGYDNVVAKPDLQVAVKAANHLVQ